MLLNLINLCKITGCSFDVIQIDWTIDPVEARKRVGPNKTLQGNLDPCTLYASDAVIQSEVEAMVTSTLLPWASFAHVATTGFFCTRRPCTMTHLWLWARTVRTFLSLSLLFSLFLSLLILLSSFHPRLDDAS